MISKFGLIVRKLRKKNGDTLSTLSKQLDISLPYLSSMEVGRRIIPIRVIEKIRDIYQLNEDEYDELYKATLETNQYVDIELSKMNEAQKEVSIAFARKIEQADPDLIEKLRKVLMENDKD